MRISDWSSDVCSSDLHENPEPAMNGLALGDQEFIFMHKLERKGAGWQHGFYVLMNGEGTAKRVPSGSPCLECPTTDGDLDGTLGQFYQGLQHLVTGDQTPQAPCRKIGRASRREPVEQ